MGLLTLLLKLNLQSSVLKTDSLAKMDRLKLLQLKHVQLTGSYENFPEDLRWLCWHGFNLRTIPSDLLLGNLVAMDLSYSKLELFEPPMVLGSLKILNLKDSHYLFEICNIPRLPNLQTLILWNCHSLEVCETIGDLKSLALLDMTGCLNLFEASSETRYINPLEELEASDVANSLASLSLTSSINPLQTFSMPKSLKRLLLNNCFLVRNDYFHVNFSDKSSLHYLNLGNNPFESLPNLNHLKNLRVLDLSSCPRLKCILCLPSTLEELYAYFCDSLEKITFESHLFRLREIGYTGCSSLSEIEGLFKLVPLKELERDLEHMQWSKLYQHLYFPRSRIRLTHELELLHQHLSYLIHHNSEVQKEELDETGPKKGLKTSKDSPLLIMTGDCHLIKGGFQSSTKILYEFGIVSIPVVEKVPELPYQHHSFSSFLSFTVPSCPKNHRLQGLTIASMNSKSRKVDDGLVENEYLLAKISNITKGLNWIYNPMVFGKPSRFLQNTIWWSYWPIGNVMDIGDEMNVYIFANTMEVRVCYADFVYIDEMEKETRTNDMEQEEILGRDLSAFQLSTGAYYLSHRDVFPPMEVGSTNPDWFRKIFGDTINYIELQGWRKTGRPQRLQSPSGDGKSSNESSVV